MRILAVASFGVALIGIGVAVSGALSTVLIGAGMLIVVASPIGLLLRDSSTVSGIEFADRFKFACEDLRGQLAGCVGIRVKLH
jgi:hypothetical protein